MNRRVVFVWGPLATLAVLAGVLGLLRVYLAEATELLVQELTGAGARVERIDIGYLPPSVTLHNVAFDTGSGRFEAPRIDLYPDFSRLMEGEVSLDRAVLDRPLLRTGGPEGSEGPGGAMDPALLPRSLHIRDASLVVDRDGVPGSPVSFSADVEKRAVGAGFVVNSMSIPEFGLTFGGTVDVDSADSLKIGVNARHGTFNPSRLLEFLRRFNYLDALQLAMFGGTQKVAAEAFRLDFDAGTGAVAFAARSLSVDASGLADVAVEAVPGGDWALTCREGTLDAAQIVALVRAHPEGGKHFADGVHTLGLKELAAEGAVSLRDVRVQSRTGAPGPTGSLSLASPSLKLSLVSSRGEKQDVVLENFDGTVTLKDGRPLVGVNRLELASSAGGSGSFKGELSFPFALAGTRFQAEARQLDWFGTVLDGTADKKDSSRTTFDVTVNSGSVQVAAKGLARRELGGRSNWSVVFDDFRLAAGGSEADGEDAKPFDFGFVRDASMSGTIVARRLQYNDLPVIRDLSAKVVPAEGGLVIRGRGRVCLMRADLEMALAPDALAASVAVTGKGVPLPGVLGCFVDELPVYLRGRLTVQANFLMQGGSGRELRKSLRGSVVTRLQGMQVLKLSNLDRRLGFFMEIMNAVNLEPDMGDTLSFRDGLVSASMGNGRVELKAVRFGGERVSVDGKGNFGLADKRLRLDAKVGTPFGVNKDVSIDMILAEEKS
ncbi:MAG: AsmA-like C-terminal region-containing protein [Pseudodesulfovibrio sp.]|jgi:hypothetical protein|uniref:AsmA-like C-terminal region-containing protein n=1 Tax=Pseudodesulfovibrio sp. TaxID=2035812 RepID=UPI003D1412CD